MGFSSSESESSESSARAPRSRLARRFPFPSSTRRQIGESSSKMDMSSETASGMHSHTPASSPISTHALVAKLHDSAQL